MRRCIKEDDIMSDAAAAVVMIMLLLCRQCHRRHRGSTTSLYPWAHNIIPFCELTCLDILRHRAKLGVPESAPEPPGAWDRRGTGNIFRASRSQAWTLHGAVYRKRYQMLRNAPHGQPLGNSSGSVSARDTGGATEFNELWDFTASVRRSHGVPFTSLASANDRERLAPP